VKITAITPYAVWVGTRNQLLVKIETDEGIFGWGESGLSGREKAVVGAIEHYTEILIGLDPFKIGQIWQLLYRSQYFEGGRVLQAAISAIDIALHDIKGKALGVPVYELLGGKQRDKIPTFATTSGEPGPEMIEQAKMLIAHGWTAMRLSPSGHGEQIYEPREHIGKTAKWMVKAREELGEDVILGIDFHHRLSVAEAASFCQKMPSGTLDFLEEPIRDETPEAYESLRTLTDVPFHRRGVRVQVAVPALHRARHSSVQPPRRVQCRRIDGIDEGRGLERGALCGHDAAQSARPDLYRSYSPLCRGGTEFLVARNTIEPGRNSSWLRQFRLFPGATAT